MNFEYFMNKSLKQADKALEINEVPIGCVIVLGDEIIGEGFNARNKNKSALAHAEMIAIEAACANVSDWRLEGATLFVTIEPCPMCAGAILQARILRVVFGAKNKKAGCCGSILNMMNDDRFNHKVEVVSGVLEDACSEKMSSYFKKLRR